MTLSTIETKEAPAAIGPYAQAVSAGSILFVSGQLGMDPATGEMVGPGFADQAHQALTNLLSIVRASGSTSKDVIAVDVFLTDMEDFAAFNDIYTDFFKTHTPARAVVAVKALPKAGCVEIKCIAQCGAH